MPVHIIPVDRLSPEAIQGVIEEFISRDGTDYGEKEVSYETKFRQVRHKLENGSAVLIFDDEAETVNIFLADNPILKKIEASE
ncbi:MAG: YheU family protein [Deltaproteobacteria bacterium]